MRALMLSTLLLIALPAFAATSLTFEDVDTDGDRVFISGICPNSATANSPGKVSQERNNNELVNNLGNFVHRVLVLTHNY